MKAFSIRQPWAFAVVMGFKDVENRTWPTRFRGPVLIHAGLKEEDADDVYFVLSTIADASGRSMAEIEIDYRVRARRGGIVGAATIIGCGFGSVSPWFFGPYGFFLADARESDFVPCRGRLGFFDVPADVLDRLKVPPYWPLYDR